MKFSTKIIGAVHAVAAAHPFLETISAYREGAYEIRRDTDPGCTIAFSVRQRRSTLIWCLLGANLSADAVNALVWLDALTNHNVFSGRSVSNCFAFGRWYRRTATTKSKRENNSATASDF